MGYIKKKITEKVTHDKKVGMVCDTCGTSTNMVEDDGWHGFYAKTYAFSCDTDNSWKTVCSPECYINLIVEYANSDGNDPEVDDMELGFMKKFIALTMP